MHGGTTQESTPQGHAPLRPGSVIGERYEVIRQLDQDPLSAIYECRDHEDDGLVWVRLASPALCPDADTAAAYMARLTSLVGARGPHLAGLRAVDVHQGTTLFVVSNRSAGTSLAAMLLDRSEARMNADELLPIMAQLSDALASCAGRHHGEVRLERVFVDTTGKVQLTGPFLVAAAPPRALATVLRAHDRLRREFAPEVLTGVARESADLYGAGQLALQALTGDRASEPGATVPARLGGVGDEIAKLIAAHPRRRPPSLTPLLDALAKQAGTIAPVREVVSGSMLELDPDEDDGDEVAEPTAVVRHPNAALASPEQSGSVQLTLEEVQIMDSGDADLDDFVSNPALAARESDPPELEEEAKTRQVKVADIQPAPSVARTAHGRSALEDARGREHSALADAGGDDGERAPREDSSDELVLPRDQATMKIAYADIAPPAGAQRTRRGASTLITRVPAGAQAAAAEAATRSGPRKPKRNILVPTLVAAVVIVAASLAFALFRQWRAEQDQHERVREHIENLEREGQSPAPAIQSP
ncbi:MAG: hypothetical protein H6726_06950 [Sandaracinaceae bacterium]|nr:hypothetical protein [Myxococcales bacterium]MCB9657376.1 hypothetical protein [Sandaracinaceae bacterium]